MKVSTFEKVLKVAMQKGASDIHFKTGSQPMMRIAGTLYAVKNLEPLTNTCISQIATTVLPKDLFDKFESKDINELDSSIQYKEIGRFRVTMFRGFGGVRIVLRIIKTDIPAISDLMLPPVLLDLVNSHRGLILVTGVTGSGKSTTIASMIEHINNNFTKHIVTIEDPIEFVFKDKKSIVSQREIGVDTDTFSDALRAALRQDPDVILVGEMRDYETVSAALMAAETGHLVISTLHTIGAAETINRILSYFPATQHQQVRNQMAQLLRGIVSQRLVPSKDNLKQVPAVEVMTNNARIAELIIDPERTREITDVIAEGKDAYGMQSFDQSLIALLKEGLITIEEAVNHCSDKNQFMLRLKGITTTTTWDEGDEDDISSPSLASISMKLGDE